MKKGQSLIEFAIVLSVFLVIVLAIINYSLINRARWQIETIADEVMANVQLQDRAICKNMIRQEFEKRLKLIYPSDIVFNCIEDGESYMNCTSDVSTGDSAKFIINANCPTSESEPVSFYIKYNYTGFFDRIHPITSSFNSSIPKF